MTAPTRLKSIAPDCPGKLVQVCYVVPDLHTAIAHWLAHTSAGPFYRMRVDLSGQLYRGEQVHGAIDVAIGYQYDLNIELVQFHGAGPSIYTGGLPGREFGLHHLQFATDDLDVTLEAHRGAGEEVVLDWVSPFGRTAFVDTTPQCGHFIEYGLWTPAIHEILDGMKRAHATWDARDPVRAYPRPRENQS